MLGNRIVIAEYIYKRSTASWSLEHTNIYGNDLLGKLVASSNQRLYNITDHLGSVRVVVKDSAGTAVVSSWQDYYAFGKVSRSSYDASNKPAENFTGHQLDDESTLLYAGARYLNVEIGRWTSVDPMSQYASGYTYCGNNPVAVIDPSGMEGIPSGCTDILSFEQRVTNSTLWVFGSLPSSQLGSEKQNPPSFASLMANYPFANPTNGLPYHPVTKKAWVTDNQCAPRASIAFTKSGFDISGWMKDYDEKGVKNPNYVIEDGEAYLIRAATFVEIGDQVFKNRKEFHSAEEFDQSPESHTNGMIFFRNSGPGTADHIGFWNGSEKFYKNPDATMGRSGPFLQSPLIIFWEIK